MKNGIIVVFLVLITFALGVCVGIIVLDRSKEPIQALTPIQTKQQEELIKNCDNKEDLIEKQKQEIMRLQLLLEK